MQNERNDEAARILKRPGKRWIVSPEETSPAFAELVDLAGSEIVARLLVKRGITDPEQARAFLNPENYVPSGPESFPAMEAAVTRIESAIEKGEKIVVYGDYDVDGVTSTCVMISTLRLLGANADFYIPNRLEEGYGLNLKAVSILASKHRARLIITCDCGVSNFAEINLARSLGVDTIIADHHSMPEILPPAVAILHPKQLDSEHPLANLSGVGVAYKLSEALLLAAGKQELVPDLLDLTTMGLIADMVPLVKENRYLVQIGLPKLAASTRPGIRALLENTAAMDGTDVVGFGLAPRINAVGRLADASVAVRLLLSTEATEAFELARKLEVDNQRRQELCEQIFFEADRKAQAALAQGDRALALYGKDWHHGVVGIVASRLVEKYHCPTFIAQLDEAEGRIKGSARGVEGIDLYQVLKANESLLQKWGGHQMAAGFSADSQMADAVCRALVETCSRMLADVSPVPKLAIDMELASGAVSMGLARELTRLGPFGMGNRKPVFAMTGLKVKGLRALGKEGKHHRIDIVDPQSGNEFECVLWRSAGRVPEQGSGVDVAFACEINSFNGKERLQLNMLDWRLAGSAPQVCDEIIDCAPLPEAGSSVGTVAAVPDRNVEDPAAPLSMESCEAPGEKEKSASPIVRFETQYDGVTASTRSVEAAAPVPSTESGAVAGEATELADLAASAAPAQRGLQKIQWKDLREHSSARTVLSTATTKLGDRLAVFAEAQSGEDAAFLDRQDVIGHQHLLIWQYPPTLDVFQNLVTTSRATTVYLVGSGAVEHYDATTFLKRLLGIVRFAVSKRDGEAHIDKIAAAMAGSRMSVALGLLILRKLHVIDWYSDNSIVYLDLIGPPSESWHELPEYQQLTLHLREVTDFRRWCAETPLEDIQLALVPNSVRMPAQPGSKEGASDSRAQGRNYNDRKGYIKSSEQGQG